MLSKNDIGQIESHGLTLEQIYDHLEIFTSGIPATQVVTAATVGNGIEVISAENKEKLLNFYDSKKDKLDIVKFVPASGAATRMFKFLFDFLTDFDPENVRFSTFLSQQKDKSLETFFGSINEFPFTNQVRKAIRSRYDDYKHFSKGKRLYLFVKTMLEEDGLNFNNLPKGLIPFHKYSKYSTTAFEEHLYEAAFYASVKDEVYLHFTFSEGHMTHFKKVFHDIQKRVSRKTKANFHVSYSFQKKETDTIAVTEDNFPFRDANGQLVLRPAGHGALLENLNEVDADVVFIKNIDNVSTSEFVHEIANNKKILGGKLLWLQQKIFNYLEELESDITVEKMKEIQSFLWNELNIKDIPQGRTAIISKLNRPLRVCGVVKNTGAPGGGPFWVKNELGETTPQIVELSQINFKSETHKMIIKEATHFNPVDIVCGLRDYKGKKFDLLKYVDHDTGFISKKSLNGVPLKALELPGLWNGSMAHWLTVFVEVPLQTFNPVKTVNDLLNKEHRPNP